MTEHEWLERGLRDAVLAGDQRAWRSWYEREYAPLEAYVLWRCGNGRDLADDVLQETWMTAVRGVRKFRPDAGSFRNWLRGIAANVLRNQLRSRQRKASRERPMNGEMVGEDSSHLDQERSERIARSLDSLSDRYEQVLRMKYLDGMSMDEIGTVTGEAESAIESLLTRARAAFREVYGDD